MNLSSTFDIRVGAGQDASAALVSIGQTRKGGWSRPAAEEDPTNGVAGSADLATDE